MAALAAAAAAAAPTRSRMQLVLARLTRTRTRRASHAAACVGGHPFPSTPSGVPAAAAAAAAATCDNTWAHAGSAATRHIHTASPAWMRVSGGHQGALRSSPPPSDSHHGHPTTGTGQQSHPNRSPGRPGHAQNQSRHGRHHTQQPTNRSPSDGGSGRYAPGTPPPPPPPHSRFTGGDGAGSPAAGIPHERQQRMRPFMIHSELAKAATKEIQRCVIEGRLDNAIETLNDLRDELFHPRRFHVKIVVDACIQANRLHDAEQLVDDVISEGTVPDVRLFNTMLAAHVNARNTAKIAVIVDQMERFGVEPNMDTYVQLFMGYCWTFSFDKAFDILSSLRADAVPLHVVLYRRFYGQLSRKPSIRVTVLRHLLQHLRAVEHPTDAEMYYFLSSCISYGEFGLASEALQYESVWHNLSSEERESLIHMAATSYSKHKRMRFRSRARNKRRGRDYDSTVQVTAKSAFNFSHKVFTELSTTDTVLSPLTLSNFLGLCLATRKLDQGVQCLLLLKEQGLRADCWRLVASLRAALQSRNNSRGVEIVDELQYQVLTKEAGEVLRRFTAVHKETGMSRQAFAEQVADAQAAGAAGSKHLTPEVKRAVHAAMEEIEASDSDDDTVSTSTAMDGERPIQRLSRVASTPTSKRHLTQAEEDDEDNEDDDGDDEEKGEDGEGEDGDEEEEASASRLDDEDDHHDVRRDDDDAASSQAPRAVRPDKDPDLAKLVAKIKSRMTQQAVALSTPRHLGARPRRDNPPHDAAQRRHEE